MLCDLLTVYSLAYIEMRLILTKLLWTFDLEMGQGNIDPAEQKVFNIWEKGPLMVRMTPVQR